jgi:hypothetical protein
MLEEDLKAKIQILQETVWERRAPWDEVQGWLSNFLPDRKGRKSEKLHALYLLSQFMYFGNKEMRELLRALYRDLYRYPIIEKIRRRNRHTIDMELIKEKYKEVLQNTRFLGVGNPSESGPHLLYYFRQENELPKSLFIHTHEIFSRTHNRLTRLREPSVSKYVFIDDLCGSGDQAITYSREVVSIIKGLKRNVSVAYYVLFATTDGLTNIKSRTDFDDIKCIFELDDSFKCFGDNSRYFASSEQEIDRNFAKRTCKRYGEKLFPGDPLGYRDNQLLIGFYHNTPDNTLPIIWCDGDSSFPWKPIFRRYPKAYGWADIDV